MESNSGGLGARRPRPLSLKIVAAAARTAPLTPGALLRRQFFSRNRSLLPASDFGCDQSLELSCSAALSEVSTKDNVLNAYIASSFSPRWTSGGSFHYHRAKGFASYKRKDKKVQPVDEADPEGQAPGGLPGWYGVLLKEALDQSEPMPGRPFKQHIKPRYSREPRGYRLTSDRFEDLKVSDQLWPRERDMLAEILYNREPALAWDFSHLSRIRPEVFPPQRLNVVKHTAWQAPSFPVPRALQGIVIKMLQERLDAGLLEPCDGPYRNSWFLVGKKESGKYRLINSATCINAVTRRDAGLPPDIEEFVSDFAGMRMMTLMDMFSGYDQLTLDLRSRDLTGFPSPLGLLRSTSVPQGTTNGVAQFSRCMSTILGPLAPQVANNFFDDVGVKAPKTTYDNEESLPGIRRFVMEHLQNLDAVLERIELAGGVVSAVKSHFCTDRGVLVGFVVGAHGRTPESKKIVKILDWPPCRSATEAKGFVGLCVYYRLWVKDFAFIAEPIYVLFRKNQPFVWGIAQDKAMGKLKEILTSAPALSSIDYADHSRDIILAVDASGEGWGSCLMQMATDGIRRHIIRFDSGLWNDSEKKYDAGKRECRGLLKALKKCKHLLIGARFVVELDAKTLVAQLNRSAADLPGALVSQWLAWIRLFDFEVQHVPGRKHSAADALSRKPWAESDALDDAEPDIDEYVEQELFGSMAIFAAAGRRGRAQRASEPSRALNPDSVYSDFHLQVADYLTTLRRPKTIPKNQFSRFRKKALKYCVQEGELFRRGTKNMPLRRVVDGEPERQEVIESLHDQHGHPGHERTAMLLTGVYWWDGLWGDVKRWVQTCEECQRRSSRKYADSFHATWSSAIWERVHLDTCRMPCSNGKNYLVQARDDLSGWPEARALSANNAPQVAKFLWEEIITRHGCFNKLVIDGGPENKGVVQELAGKYGIRAITTSGYNPQANGLVERGHRPFLDGLAKMPGGNRHWVRNLPVMLWSERTTVSRTRGSTPYEICYGSSCVLPIETRILSWNTLPWHTVRTTGDLLAMRAEQLLRRDLDLEEVRARVKRIRLESAEAASEYASAEDRVYGVGDLVLVYNSRFAVDRTADRKLAFRWLGPYRILEQNVSKGTYILEELDGARLRGTYSGRRLKKFYPRTETPEPPPLEHTRDADDLSEHEESDSDQEETENLEESDPGSETELPGPGPRVQDQLQRYDSRPPVDPILPDDLRRHIPAGQDFAVVLPGRAARSSGRSATLPKPSCSQELTAWVGGRK